MQSENGAQAKYESIKDNNEVRKSDVPRPRPVLRFEHDLLSRVNENGEFDYAAREQAVAQVGQMQVANATPTRAGVAAGSTTADTAPRPRSAVPLLKGTTAGLHHDNSGWTSLGPHDKVGGRTLAILHVKQAIDPENPDDKENVIYAGAASGGVWYSDDQGENWVPTEDLMPNLGVSSLAADPKDKTGQTIFAGTGEGALTRHVENSALPVGSGIFKSTDGWTWKQIEKTKPTNTENAFTAVDDLVFTKDGKTLLAATQGGIRYSVVDAHEEWNQAEFSPGMLQAENATTSGGATNGHQNNGFTGKSHSALYAANDKLTFQCEAVQAKRCNLSIRYASVHASAGATIELKVNDTAHSITLDRTSASTDWRVHTLQVELEAGSNTISVRLEAGTVAQLAIDCIFLETPNRLIPETKRLMESTVAPTVKEAGDYELRFRYIAKEQVSMTLEINADDATNKKQVELLFPSTNSAQALDFLSQTLKLKAGANTLRFQSGLAVDSIEVEPSEVEASELEAPSKETMTLDIADDEKALVGSSQVVQAKKSGKHILKFKYSAQHKTILWVKHNDAAVDDGGTKLVFEKAAGSSEDNAPATCEIDLKEGANTLEFETTFEAGYIDFFPPGEGEKMEAKLSSLSAHPQDSNLLLAGQSGGGLVFFSEDGGKRWRILPPPADNQASGRVEVAFAKAALIAVDVEEASASGDTAAETARGSATATAAPASSDTDSSSSDSSGSESSDTESSDTESSDAGDAGASGSAAGTEDITSSEAPEPITGIGEIPAYVFAEKKQASPKGVIWRCVFEGTNSRLLHRSAVDKVFQAQGTENAGQGYYDICLWAGDAKDANLVVVGGVDIYRSKNGGETSEKIGGYEVGSIQRFPHLDQHFLVEDIDYDSETNPRVWLGNDGGIFTTENIKTVAHQNQGTSTPSSPNWVMKNHGYTVTQFYYGCGNPGKRVVLCGAQDNGTLAHSSGYYDWDSSVMGGDGGATAFDPNDATRFYAEYQNMGLNRLIRTEATRSWVIAQNIKPDLGSESPVFIAPFQLDTVNSKVLYAGAESLWRMSIFTGDDFSMTRILNGETTQQTLSNTATEVSSSVSLQANNTLVYQVGNEDTGYVWIFDIGLSSQLFQGTAGTLGTASITPGSTATFRASVKLAAEPASTTYKLEILYALDVDCQLTLKVNGTAQTPTPILSGNRSLELVLPELLDSENSLELGVEALAASSPSSGTSDASSSATAAGSDPTAAAAGTPTLTVIRMNLHLPPLKVSQAKKRPETLKSTGAGAIPCDKGDKLTYNFEVVAGNYAMKTGYLPATSEKLIWKKIRPGTAGKQVSAIAVSGSTAETPASTPTAGTSAENYSDMVLVGYANGEVWLSKDTNVPNAELSGTRPTWTSMNVAVNRYCTRVLIDPKDENVLFACFGGFAAGNLQMSTDQGDTWSSISEGLPNAPVHCLAVHPDNSNWLYAGTDVGLFASEDRGATWAVSNEGPASVAVSDMFWMGTTLVAVTFGRGVFQIDIPIHKKAKAILFGDTDGALVEIAQDSSDSNTGHVVRSEFLAENVELLSPMLAIHNTTTLKDTFGTTLAEKLKNTVFAGGSSGSLYWNDIATLESNWNSAKKLDGSIFARPELWHEPESESLSIVVTDNKGFLHGFDLATGNEALMKINVCQLKDEETVEVYSNEVVDNWAYVATSKGLYGVRLVGDQPGVEFKKDGSEDKSDADAGEESAFPTTHRVPPLIAGQMIFAASEDEDGNGTLSAFDARTGKQRWSNECCYRPCQPVWALGAVVVAGEGELVAYHHESGKELVRQQCGIVESLSADDCMLYFVAGDELCKWQLKPARDTWSIEKLQSAKVPMGSQYAPLVVDQEIYVLGIDANVRCFKSTATGLKEMWTCETYGTPAHTAAIPIFEQVTPDEKKPATHAPKGAEVALALDVSGSMKGRPLASLKRATQKLIYMLHPYDSLGIATFNHQAKCAWGDGGNTRGLDYHFDKNDAADAVQQIRAGGGTNIGLGLEQASEMLGTKSNPSSKAVVLLSDGKNHPEGLPPDEMWVRGKLEDAKIAIYTVALGAEADHAMLEKIAGRRNAHVAHDDHEIDLIFKDIMGAANIASVIVNERKEAKPHMPVAGKAAPVPPGAQVATAAVSWKTPGVQLANSPSPGEAETPAKFEMHVELTDAQGQAVPSNELEVYPSDNSVVIKHNLTPSSPRELKALATVRPTEFGESQMRNETSLETVPLSISISTNPLPYHLDIQRSDRQEQRVLSFSVKMMDEKTGAAMNIVDFETNAWYAQSSECQLKIGEADPFSRTVDLRTDQRGAYRIEFVVTAVDSSTGEKVKLTRHATARV